VAKKNKDRIKTDIEISYLIAEDAFRKITDNQKTYRGGRRLFNEISENLSPETAASIFRFTMKKRKRGKSYDPVLEMALRLHARVNSSHETARLAHETYRIGNSVGALQRHIQRLLAKSDDSRDK
jgi:hypothetical protein